MLLITWQYISNSLAFFLLLCQILRKFEHGVSEIPLGKWTWSEHQSGYLQFRHLESVQILWACKLQHGNSFPTIWHSSCCSGRLCANPNMVNVKFPLGIELGPNINPDISSSINWKASILCGHKHYSMSIGFPGQQAIILCLWGNVMGWSAHFHAVQNQVIFNFSI